MNKDGALNGRLVTNDDFIKQKASMLTQPSMLPKSKVKISSPEEAYKVVIAQVGCSLHRDAVDTRIIGYVTSLGKTGKIFKTEEEAGGQPAIAEQHSAVKDGDANGIPDDWEKANKLKAGDAQQTNANGYTYLEEYLNSLVKM